MEQALPVQFLLGCNLLFYCADFSGKVRLGIVPLGHERSHCPKQRAKSRDVYFDEVELALSQALGSKVRVIQGSKKHLLEIEFYSKEELSRLANRLAGESE